MSKILQGFSLLAGTAALAFSVTVLAQMRSFPETITCVRLQSDVVDSWTRCQLPEGFALINNSVEPMGVYQLDRSFPPAIIQDSLILHYINAVGAPLFVQNDKSNGYEVDAVATMKNNPHWQDRSLIGYAECRAAVPALCAFELNLTK